MREPDLQIRLDDEQAVERRGGEELLEVRLREQVRQLRYRRASQGGDRLVHGDQLVRQRVQPLGDRAGQRAGKGQGLGTARAVAPRQAAGQLERVERVAARDLVDPAQGRTRDRPHDPGEHAPQRRLVQRTQVASIRALRREHGGDTERVHRVRVEPHRREDPDRVGLQPPERVPQRVRRHRVQPLEVVDRDDDRPALDRPSDRVQDRPTASERVLRPKGFLVDRHVLDQVDEANERERHLLLGRPSDEDAVPEVSAALHAEPPERGLPDPRAAADQERAEPLRNGLREGLDT